MSPAVARRPRTWLSAVTVAVLTVAILALALVVNLLIPGATMRSAPFSVTGIGRATSGPLTAIVHDARLATAVEVDGERRTTTGVFVVLDTEITTSELVGTLSQDLMIDGRRFALAAKGPNGSSDTSPAPGLPVQGDLVFEVDEQLLHGDTEVRLRVAEGLTAHGDLQPQAVVRAAPNRVVESVLTVEGLSR